MVDLILFSFVVGVFAGGFWCGKTYGSAKAMYADIKARVAKVL